MMVGAVTLLYLGWLCAKPMARALGRFLLRVAADPMEKVAGHEDATEPLLGGPMGLTFHTS
eukprot:10383913-Alexandrium_andersonii.AAC.1